MPDRNVKIIRDKNEGYLFPRIEFTRGENERIQRNVTPAELARLKEIMSDPRAVDNFCYSIT